MTSENETNTWALGEGIDTENITSAIPKSSWDDFLWLAIRAAIAVSATKENVIMNVLEWNQHNDPKLDERSVVKKTLWALKTWEYQLASA